MVICVVAHKMPVCNHLLYELWCGFQIVPYHEKVAGT